MDGELLDQKWVLRAVELSAVHMRSGEGGPFGAVVIRDNEVIAEGWNQVTASNDPTAHAEIVAIRHAAAALGSFRLTGCVLYSSCEPCPMCLAAAWWARVDRVVYAAGRDDAAEAGFDDTLLYEELALPLGERRLAIRQCEREAGRIVLREWSAMPNKIQY